jgi:pimeloyl-ACP methyl ester carboxylesterase
MLVRMDRTAPTATARPPRAADLPPAPARPRRAGARCVVLALLASLLLAPRADAAPGQGQFEFLTAPDGVPLCVFETGNPQGRELLLIHGFSQSYAVFKRQYEGGLAADHRIVAFDLRGHGCSGKPWDEAAYADTRTWGNDVDAVIRAKKLQRPLLVGWSFGGYVAVNYVEHHGTGRIAGVVLVGSNAGMLPPPSDPAVKAQMDAARTANANKLPDVEAGIAEGHGFVRIMTAKPAPPDMADIMFATNQMLPAYARRAMSRRSLQADAVVPRMTTPTLLLVGDKDGSQSVDVLGGLAKQLPDGRLKVMPGAGHAAFIDSPQEFDAALREFEAYAAAAPGPWKPPAR